MNDETTSLEPQKESGTEKSPYVSVSTVAYQSITPTVSHRYTPLKFHARGGVGEVWLAEDGEIGRQVALKRLSRNNDGTNERFLAEAQIAGQLEHPGIVPVHDLGIDKSGNPYYVMKFVHGRTMRDAIEEYHASENKNVSERVLQQQRLLDHFVDVCEAVAFAHTRGVVHRDLKPSNIMLGLFGETIVLDWGLAKVLNQPELPGLPTALTSSGRSSETALGSVLGTPSYMPPEIAEGKAADAGPATDVYLLGATLYEVLTGIAPRSGSSIDEIVQLARNVTPVPPRQKNKRVARPLEAICLKAMAKREVDRYESAMDLAEDTRRYLAGEPVSAYREPLITRASRWVKRHRRGLTRAATAAMIAALVLVASAAVVDSRNRAAEAERESAEIAAVQQARGDLELFRSLYDEAMFHIGSENPDEQFTYYDPTLGRDFADEALMMTQKWGSELNSFPLPEERDRLQQELYELLLLKAQVATMFPSSDHLDQTLVDLERAKSLSDEPTQSFYRLRADFHRRQGDLDAASQDDELAADDAIPVSAFDYFLRGEQFRTVSIEPNDPLEKFKFARFRDLDSAIAEYRKALQIDADHYWSRLQLGRCYLATRQFGEAIESLGGCAALRPDSHWAFTARALALAREERFDEALRDLNYVLQMQPDFHPARLNRGWVHWQQQNFDDAITDFESVLAAPEKPLILAAFYLGQLHLARRDLAKGDLNAALKQFNEFAKGNQQNDFRPVHRHLAEVHYLLGKYVLGLQHLNQYLQLSLPPGQFNPNAPEARFYRGQFLRQLTTSKLKELRDRASNANASQQRIAQLRAIQKNVLALALKELKDAETEMQSADLYYELGLVNEKLRQFANAEEIYSKGLSIDANNLKLLNKRGQVRWLLKKNDLAQQDYTRATRSEAKGPRDDVLVAEAYGWSGILFTQGKQIDRAFQQAARSLAAILDVPKGEPETYIVLHNIACVYGGISQLDPENRDELQDMAIEILEQAIDKAIEVGAVDSELVVIKNDMEDAQFLGPALQARPEFKALLNVPATKQ